MSLRRADHSSRGVLPTVVRRYVWSRNLKTEEAITRVGSQRHGEKNNIYWREQLWSSHLRDAVVLWTSVPVAIFKNFNCVLKHTHKCWTTGIVVSTFILSLQHSHFTHASCMHIFLVILGLITLMTFREEDKLRSSPLHDFLHPAVTSTPTHLPEPAVLKGLSF